MIPPYLFPLPQRVDCMAGSGLNQFRLSGINKKGQLPHIKMRQLPL